MPWNAGNVVRSDGTRSGSNVWQQANAAGVLIVDTDHDLHDEDLAGAIEETLHRGGQNSPTTHISWGGFRITVLGSPTARGDAANAGYVQDGGSTWAGTSSGTAAVQTVNLSPAITAYSVGQMFHFRAGFNCPGAMTLNFNGIGAGAVQRFPGTDPLSGDFAVDDIVHVTVIATTPVFVLQDVRHAVRAIAEAVTPKIKGLRGGEDVDTEHDIYTEGGWCWDSTYTSRMVLSAQMTKQIDNSWAVGDDAGGIDTGSVAADTWYARHLIKNPTTGVVDVLLSLSATAPTLPSGYTLFRRIGWHLTDGSANLISVLQDGDRFNYRVPIQDFDANAASTQTLTVLSVPPSARPFLTCRAKSADSSLRYILISSADMTNSTPSSALYNLVAPVDGHAVANFDGTFKVNSSSEIRHRADAAPELTLTVNGWIDTRGQEG